MKNNCFPSFLLAGGLLIGAMSAQAQDRVVKLTTGKAVGESITLQVNHTYTGVTVDWGDGNAVAYNTGNDAIREITGEVKGSQIVITGDKRWNMLNCSGCGLTDIDLSGATELTSLFLSNNALTTLNVQGMTALTDLDASNNQLTSIVYTVANQPENDLAAIENINLSNNQLTGTFNIRTAVLRTIDVSNNQFTRVRVTSNPELDYLNFANNKANATLSIPTGSPITTLVCNNNSLPSITLSGVTNLQQLVIDNNNISSTFDLADCANLSDVSLANNKISTLYLPNTKLSSLNIAGNKLTLGALPLKANAPAGGRIAFMPQDYFDISGAENMLKEGGVPYVPVVTYDERTTNMLDLSAYRYIGATAESDGSLDAAASVYKIDAQGNYIELTKAASASQPNDYFVSSGKFSFFTPQPKVVVRFTSNKAYKDLGFYVETSPFAVGVEQITGIDDVASDNAEIVPGVGQITVTTHSESVVQISNILGQTMYMKVVNGTETISLPQGIYVVRIENVNGQEVDVQKVRVS